MPTVDLFLPPRRYATWRPARREDVARVPVHPVAAAWLLLKLWITRSRQRQALSELDTRLLQDIGITRVDAAREFEKPFWCR